MSEVADYSVGEPEPIRNTGEASVHDLVCEDLVNVYGTRNVTAKLVAEDMQQRKSFGFQKYGTLLQASNGRDPLKDGYAEILDALVYCRQALERHIAPPSNLMYKELIEIAFRWRTLIYLNEKNEELARDVKARSRELRK